MLKKIIALCLLCTSAHSETQMVNDAKINWFRTHTDKASVKYTTFKVDKALQNNCLEIVIPLGDNTAESHALAAKAQSAIVQVHYSNDQPLPFNGACWLIALTSK
ncbi:hypothetical protein [Agarilytica rhodophyticola]|uniref:hypothetical protein n=1 Tax=Agarilytica rhodophyticola TaxID=1737490 RepID=UPI000B348C39|nr:hypothetical protein [Agarilytica rhodophyticola]